MMLRIYCAGPYNAENIIGSLDNMRRGMKVAYEVLKAGMAPFCPWMDFHYSLNGPVTIDEYYEYSLAWLRVSDAVLLVEGWESSKGTLREIGEAERLGIPVLKDFDALLEWRKYQ